MSTHQPAVLTFEVPGEPVGKGRHRTAARRGKGGKTYLANITPDKTVRYESDVALFAAQAMAGRELLAGPLWIHVTAFFARPKSHPKSRRPDWVTKKPDLSNCLKALEDGMNGVVFVDDSQLASVSMTKRWDASPRVVVSIGRLVDYENSLCQTAQPVLKD